MQNKVALLGAMVWLSGRVCMGGAMCSAAAGGMDNQSESSFSGVVLETTNASRYTYVQIDTGKEKIWAAGPVFTVKVGDRVDVQGGMLSKNFKSKVLNRNFEELYLAGLIAPSGSAPSAKGAASGALPPGHPDVSGKVGAATESIQPIKKPDGGKTVAEIWAGKASLTGKTVLLRAKVVRVSANILGMNWLHLRDGSGAEGSNDLAVTTKDEVHVGDVITVSGTLSTDKDFGSGYHYDVILEQASVVVK